ncbi:MAG: hypothetical protein ACO1RX_17330 [Candidatus Sericytochromatia bacterium]
MRLWGNKLIICFLLAATLTPPAALAQGPLGLDTTFRQRQTVAALQVSLYLYPREAYVKLLQQRKLPVPEQSHSHYLMVTLEKVSETPDNNPRLASQSLKLQVQNVAHEPIGNAQGLKPSLLQEAEGPAYVSGVDLEKGQHYTIRVEFGAEDAAQVATFEWDAP